MPDQVSPSMVPVRAREGARRAGLLVLGVLLWTTGCRPESPPAPEPAVDPEPGISGRAAWRGSQAPDDSPVPASCGAADPRVLVTGTDRGLPDVVVQIATATGEAAPRELTLRASGCRYSVAAAVVGPKARLRVENLDPVVHTFHLRRADGSSIQNLAVPPGGDALTWVLPEQGTVLVSSDQLPWMRTTIRIVDGTAWAVSDAEGRFSFPELAGGTYEVELVHPAFGTDVRTVVVPDDGPAALYVDYD